MNAFEYQLGRFAQALGIRREKTRLGALTRETQFYNEAMDLLGRAAWQDTSEIDDLAVEFWQIRDVETKQKKLRLQKDEITRQHEDLQDQRGDTEGEFNDQLDRLKETKLKKMSSAIELMREIETRKESLERMKRRYAGMKLRLRASEEEATAAGSSPPDTRDTTESMEEIKAEYGREQKELEQHSTQLKSLEAEIAEIDLAIESKRKELKQAIARIVSQISKGSRDIAELSAQIGSLQNSKNALATRIGRYLSQNINSPNPEIRSVLRKHRPLASKISYYRKSISYFQKLTRRG